MVRAGNKRVHALRAARRALTGKRRALCGAVCVRSAAWSRFPLSHKAGGPSAAISSRSAVRPCRASPSTAIRLPEPRRRVARHLRLRDGVEERRIPSVSSSSSASSRKGQRGNESRNMLPMVENEIRRIEQENRAGQQQLDRECYEYFLFSKTLRRTRKCVDLASQVDEARRRIADLEAQQQQLSSGRSYQDDIVRELARNNCGAAYQQQARRHDNDDSSIWNDEESSGGGMGGSFGSLPYATYRTVCVRLCDGYYFPISFSTLPNHFERDAEACSSKCAAPAELCYYQNPGGSPDQMTAARTNELYTQLKSAFRYRKEYVQGCSCKITEYVPEAGAPQQHGEATPGATRSGICRRAGFVATAPPASSTTPQSRPQSPPLRSARRERAAAAPLGAAANRSRHLET